MRTAEQLKPYQFKKGQSGNPSGCPKGVKMIRENALKAYFRVFEELGEWEGLHKWVKESSKHKQTFYSWLIPLMPKEIKLEGEGFGDTKIIIVKEANRTNNIRPTIPEAISGV